MDEFAQCNQRLDEYGFRMNVELRQLHCLVAVVDEGTFTDAAIALDVSQATVSRQVAALEAAVGARLLERSARDVRLTEEGRRVLPHARAVLAQVAALEQTAGAALGEFRLGFAWGAMGRHTRALQRRFAEATGGSELVFVQSTERTAGLETGRVHAAVTRWRLDERNLEQELIGVERRFAALPVEDELADRPSLSVLDLAGRTIAIDREVGTTTTELWPADAAPAAVRSVRGVEAWLTLIGAGQAIGMTAEASVERHRSDDVVYLPINDAPPIQVWLAWPRDAVAPGTQELLRLARELYAAG